MDDEDNDSIEVDQGQLVAQALSVDLPELSALQEEVAADYSAADWGLRQLAGVIDELNRAAASELLMVSLQGVTVAISDLALRLHQHAELVGPNGRVMPRDDPADVLRFVEAGTCEADCFRAVGTALDCLATATALLTGAPVPGVQRINGDELIGWADSPGGNSGVQKAARKRIATVVVEEGSQPVVGWLAWTLETRNAVVHRGPLLRAWVAMPSRGTSLMVRSASPPSHLVRHQPHLRRRPWLLDVHGFDPAEAWLAEPATATLLGIATGAMRVVERWAAEMRALWRSGDVPSFDWPATWRLRPRGQTHRTQRAEQFAGFDPSYPVDGLANIRAHPETAERMLLADRVRKRGTPPSDP